MKIKAPLWEGEPLPLEFEKQPSDYDSDGFTVSITLGKECVGYGEFGQSKQNNILFVRGLEVKTEYRRKGIATALYDYVEKTTGKIIEPGDDQTKEAKIFWENRRKK